MRAHRRSTRGQTPLRAWRRPRARASITWCGCLSGVERPCTARGGTLWGRSARPGPGRRPAAAGPAPCGRLLGLEASSAPQSRRGPPGSGWCTAQARVRARQCHGRERHCTGAPCWARGDAVSTGGGALEPVRASRRAPEAGAEAGRFESTTPGVRSTAFEAARLIKPPALPGVSDSFLGNMQPAGVQESLWYPRVDLLEHDQEFVLMAGSPRHEARRHSHHG